MSSWRVARSHCARLLSRRAAATLLLCAGCWGSALAASDLAWPPWEYSSPPARSGNLVDSQPENLIALDVAAEVEPAPSTVALAAVAAIRFYQIVLSKPYNTAFNPGGCPFTPSCSEYGLIAFRAHGAPRAILMTGDRLMRCHAGAFLYGYDVAISGERAHLENPPLWLGCGAPSEVLDP